MVIIDDSNFLTLCKLFGAVRSPGVVNLNSVYDRIIREKYDMRSHPDEEGPTAVYMSEREYDVAEELYNRDPELYAEYCKFVITTPIGTWDVSRVTNMDSAFAGSAISIFGDIDYRDVNDDGYVGKAVYFDEEDMFLDKWNVSNVTSMRRMFAAANSSMNTFIYGLDRVWDTSKVTTMEEMFFGAHGINGRTWGRSEDDNDDFIGKWNVSSLENAERMFTWCDLDADLSSWNVGKLKNANAMFVGCEKFESDLSGWRLPADFHVEALDYDNKDAFMFTLPMEDQPSKWPPLPADPLPVGPCMRHKCMTEEEFETCEKDEKGQVVDPISVEVLNREQAVKLPGTNQCYSRSSLRNIVRHYKGKNPMTREPIPTKWLDEWLKERDNPKKLFNDPPKRPREEMTDADLYDEEELRRIRRRISNRFGGTKRRHSKGGRKGRRTRKMRKTSGVRRAGGKKSRRNVRRRVGGKKSRKCGRK